MTDVKKKLIEELEKIDDAILLDQLTDLVSQSKDILKVEFTEEQISTIKESQNQIKRGELKTHDQVMKDFGNA